MRSGLPIQLHTPPTTSFRAAILRITKITATWIRLQIIIASECMQKSIIATTEIWTNESRNNSNSAPPTEESGQQRWSRGEWDCLIRSPTILPVLDNRTSSRNELVTSFRVDLILLVSYEHVTVHPVHEQQSGIDRGSVSTSNNPYQTERSPNKCILTKHCIASYNDESIIQECTHSHNYKSLFTTTTTRKETAAADCEWQRKRWTRHAARCSLAMDDDSSSRDEPRISLDIINHHEWWHTESQVFLRITLKNNILYLFKLPRHVNF